MHTDEFYSLRTSPIFGTTCSLISIRNKGLKRFKGCLVGLFQHCSRRLIVLLPPNEFIHLQRRHAPYRRERPLLAKEGTVLPRNLASKSGIYESIRFFYMPQGWDMGQFLSLPLRRKAWWGLFGNLKNPTASAAFEPANSGIRGQHGIRNNLHPVQNSSHHTSCTLISLIEYKTVQLICTCIEPGV